MFNNKMISTIVFASIICLLIGCGGSGTGTGPTSFVTLKTYPSGTSVLTSEDTSAAELPHYNSVAIHENMETVKEVFDDSANTQITIVSDDEEGVVITEIGTSSAGKTIQIGYLGYYLDAAKNEFVALAEGMLDGEYGVLSGGVKVNGMPSGTYTYQGVSNMAMNGSTQGQTVLDTEVGTSSMTANFSNNTGSLQTNTSSYSYNENNIVINPSDGSFSGSTGTIGMTGGTMEAANVKGYFSGTNAAGMHGAAYSAGNQDNFATVFVGKKQ